MPIKYPDEKMRDYKRRPLKRGRFRRHKYHNHKCHEDGFTFDSKTELEYYNLLKLERKTFRVHPRYEIIPHGKYNRRHSYTPDFVLYNGDKVCEVDDIKGMQLVPAYDHLRMDLFSRKYHIPVTIVRKKHGHFVKKVR